jgi:hypothetical protein
MLPKRADGTITIDAAAREVLWEPSADFASDHPCSPDLQPQSWKLSEVERATITSLRTSPFTQEVRLTLRVSASEDVLEFEVCGVGIVPARAFALELQTATDAARGAADSAPAAAVATSSGVKLTARVRMGRELRAELQRINRLHGKGKWTDAAAAMAALDADAPSTDKARRAESSLAKQRVRQLRQEAFSYGNASLTREVLRRFIESPEVQPLLPAEVQTRQKASNDAEAKEELLATAKHFLSTIYKIRGGGPHGRGRRTDVQRNAMAAGASRRCCHRVSLRVDTVALRAESWASRIDRPSAAVS